MRTRGFHRSPIVLRSARPVTARAKLEFTGSRGLPPASGKSEVQPSNAHGSVARRPRSAFSLKPPAPRSAPHASSRRVCRWARLSTWPRTLGRCCATARRRHRPDLSGRAHAFELLGERRQHALEPQLVRRVIGADRVEPVVDQLADVGFDPVADRSYLRVAGRQGRECPSPRPSSARMGRRRRSPSSPPSRRATAFRGAAVAVAGRAGRCRLRSSPPAPPAKSRRWASIPPTQHACRPGHRVRRTPAPSASDRRCEYRRTGRIHLALPRFWASRPARLRP